MSRFLWICLGGAVGTGARYLLSGWMLLAAGNAFPWGTLAVNAIGSFLLAAVVGVATTTAWLSPTLRLTLTTGVLGGFTTYSAFNQETLDYFRKGALALAAANVLATWTICLAAGTAGFLLVRSLLGAGV